MKLTKKMLEAMAAALDAAEASDGFNGGDFDGMDPQQFTYARTWVKEELAKQNTAAPDRSQHGRPMPRIITGPGE